MSDQGTLTKQSNLQNFSIHTVKEGEEVLVPESQQMIVFQALTIEGSLDVEGEVVVL